MMNIEIKSKRQMNTYLIIILVVITLTIIFYSYYRSHYLLPTKGVEVKFEQSDIIDITNKLPLSDTLGKSYSGTGMEKGIAGYTSFTIINPNDYRVRYEVYATKQNVEKEISDKFIVVYLTNVNNKPLSGFENNVLPTYNKFNNLSDRMNAKLLYIGSLSALSSETIKVRTWVSDTYALINEEEKFSFDIDVRIK